MAINVGQSPIVGDGLVLYLDPSVRENYILSELEVLVVAGGGGGGGWGGGGGGGGVVYLEKYAVTPGSTITVTVGGGGSPGTNGYTSGGDGGNSSFGNITAIGGGGGGHYNNNNGRPGGSGGGGGGSSTEGYGLSSFGGSGTPGQGNNGGRGGGLINGTYYLPGGGGGGAGAPGENFNTFLQVGGNGGDGLPFSISGRLRYYGGGGGGHTDGRGGLNSTSFGGKGGGGRGGNYGTPRRGLNGAANTGGGGGGSYGTSSGYECGSGGSGVVIVRYPGPQKATGGDTITQVDGYTIHTFTTVGTTTFTLLSLPSNNNAITGLINLNSYSDCNDTVYAQNGGPLYSTESGGCLRFDGVDDFLTINNTEFPAGNYLFSDPGYGPFTVSAWFKFPTSSLNARDDANNGGNTSYTIVGRSGGIAGGATFTLFVSGSETVYTASTYLLYINIRGTITQISATPVNTNTWNNVVITWNGVNNFSYLNGVGPNAVITGGASLQSYSLQIGSTAQENGSLSGWLAHAFDGSIGPVAIYDKALSQTEVQQNFNALRGRFGV